MISRLIDKAKGALQLRRALSLVWQSSPRWTVAAIILVIVQGLLPLLSLYLMKLIVDAVAGGAAATDKSVAYSQVLLLVTFAGLAALATACAASLSTYVNEGQSQCVADFMSTILQRKAVEVDLEYYENAEYFDTLHRAQSEAPFRPTRIVNGLSQFGQNLITLLSLGVVLAALHPGIIAVLLAGAIPGVLVRFRFIDIMVKWQRQRTLVERKANYFNWILTMAYWAKEVRLFDLGSLFIGRHGELRNSIRSERIAIARRRGLAETGAQFFAVLPMFASLAYIANQAVQGAITLGSLTLYYGAFRSLQTAVQGVLNSLLGLHEDNRFLANLYEFLDLKPRVATPYAPRALPQPMRRGFAFENVSFGYALSERPALQGVDLTIAPGEVVALVGENGSGKTTLVKLLCRLYDPTAGRITIDGIDIREFAPRDLRREISVIFQDYVHYDMTARENIWVGNTLLDPKNEEVIVAAQRSGADEVVKKLPQGYDTQLGRSFAGGEELSIGQWQKIALARAFLRPSQLIILDEPTSALDPRAEAEVFDKFRELVSGQAAILISHRLSTVKMADRICVMQNGRIVEDGTHHELVEQGGVYANLFETQAQAYL